MKEIDKGAASIVRKSSKILAGIALAAIVLAAGIAAVGRGGNGGKKYVFEEETRRIDMDQYKPYGKNADFEKKIAPFFWVDYDGGVSLCLSAGERFLRDVFAARSDEGFKGNGYDWTSLAEAFIEEKMPEYGNVIQFDPEMGMFSAYADDADALARFAVAFRVACGDDALIRGLLARAKTEHILDEKTFNEVKDQLLRDILNVDPGDK